jgi:hypothetical protein
MNCPAILDEGTIIEDFSDASEWTCDANMDASLFSSSPYHNRCLDDPEKWAIVVRHKSQSVPVNPGYVYKTTCSLDLSSMTSVRLDYLHVTSSEGGGVGYGITLQFSSTTDFSKYFTAYVPSASGFQSGSGARATFRKSDFVQGTGTNESWSNTMVSIRIGLTTYATSYGTGGTARFFLDKLVLDPVTKPLCVVGFNTSSATDAPAMMTVMEDYGYADKPFCSMLDYDDIGDSEEGQGDWTDIQDLAARGLHILPMFTPWLLRSPVSTGSGGDVWRSTPPYPPPDTTVPTNITDAYSGYAFRYESFVECMAAARAIHDFWNLPWNTEILLTHGGQFYTEEFYRWFWKESGFTAYADRAEYSSVTGYHGEWSQSYPLRSQFLYESLNSSTSATVAQVKTHIDAVCEGSGRYLALEFWPDGVNWTVAMMDEVISYIRDKEDLDLIELVSLPEFFAQAREYPVGKGIGYETTLALGALDLNDEVNYFVDNEGLNLGNKQRVWDEVPSYAGGANVQINVTEANLVPVTIPMRVHGVSVSDLNTKLETLWQEVDRESNTLNIGSESYNIVVSTRPDTIERNAEYQLGYDARFTLVLMREG